VNFIQLLWGLRGHILHRRIKFQHIWAARRLSYWLISKFLPSVFRRFFSILTQRGADWSKRNLASTWCVWKPYRTQQQWRGARPTAKSGDHNMSYKLWIRKSGNCDALQLETTRRRDGRSGTLITWPTVHHSIQSTNSTILQYYNSQGIFRQSGSVFFLPNLYCACAAAISEKLKTT